MLAPSKAYSSTGFTTAHLEERSPLPMLSIVACCIFRPAFGCYTLQTLIEIGDLCTWFDKMEFSFFLYFEFVPKRWLRVLFQENMLSEVKTCYDDKQDEHNLCCQKVARL